MELDITCEIVGEPKTGGVLIVADHASNWVPSIRDLNIDPRLLDLHIASDIGVKPVAEALVAAGAVDAAFLATVSRLVVDLNRDVTSYDAIPTSSDGYPISGNRLGDDGRKSRMRQFYVPYHSGLAKLIASCRPAMILSLHSFTPVLRMEPDAVRPWHIGILYNQDDRLARVAIPALEYFGLNVGDQQPYSGKELNYTMNRHAEGNGIPYLGVEMRQDLVADAEGVARMVDWVKVALSACRNELAQIAGAAE